MNDRVWKEDNYVSKESVKTLAESKKDITEKIGIVEGLVNFENYKGTLALVPIEQTPQAINFALGAIDYLNKVETTLDYIHQENRNILSQLKRLSLKFNELRL